MTRQIDKGEMPANLTGKDKPTSQTVVTPSGIEVLYQWEPKRLYRVRWVEDGERMATSDDPEYLPGQMALCGPREETHDWREVPSVTTVLEVLDKPALPWWGMRVGVEGALELFNAGLMRALPREGRPVLAVPAPVGVGEAGFVVAGLKEVEKLLKKKKLTVNDVKDKAGDRGQAVHDALEVWANTASLPDPSIYPPEEQAYVIGLVNFLEAAQPEPVDSEVMVGSVEHGFAGRYDVRWRIPKDCDVVYHVTPKRGPHFARLKAGLLLADLKTSKDVYPSHSRQLEAYEHASVECGYEPTEARGILNVGGFIKNPDTGEHEQRPPFYKFVRSCAVFEDFRVVLDVWRSDEAMKARKKEKR